MPDDPVYEGTFTTIDTVACTCTKKIFTQLNKVGGVTSAI